VYPVAADRAPPQRRHNHCDQYDSLAEKVWPPGHQATRCCTASRPGHAQYAVFPSEPPVKLGDHPPGRAPYKKIPREWATGAWPVLWPEM
jgi:hypothetical protein